MLILCLCSCYDAPRTNPFDPALTPAVELLAVTVDSTRGSATLEWTPYEGKQPFAEYRVLRKVPGLEAVDTVAAIADVRQTSFRDTTPEPEVEYVYWVEVVNQGEFAVGSGKREGVVYALPSIELLEAEFSSDTATAELVWTPYRGPGFVVYEVRRSVPKLVEEIVAEVNEVSDTTYTDTFLDGNTEYTYHVVVRTGWGMDVSVSSNKKSGKFYHFDHKEPLPEIPDAKPRAVAMTVDEQDRLYIAMTMQEISASLGSPLMKRGAQVYLPRIGFKALFEDVRPDLRSPIHVVAGQGKVYVAVRSRNGQALIAALSEEGQELWVDSVYTQEAFPIGLYLEEEGKVVIADDQALLYRFGPEGQQEEKGGLALQFALAGFQVLPIAQLVVGPEIGRDGGDQFFILVPEEREHYVMAVTRRQGAKFLFSSATHIPIDEGIGAAKGHTLNPLAMAFDRRLGRLLVLEGHSRLQVFDGRWEAQRRYITQWGRFGAGDGEFLFSRPTSAAVAVDSRGMVYVADESGWIQVFTP